MTQGSSSPLRQLDFFSFCKGLSSNELQTILKEGIFTRFDANCLIYRQGELSHSLYVINDGTIELICSDSQFQQSSVISTFQKGDVFGDLELLTQTPRAASARVTADRLAEVTVFDEKAFYNLLVSVPAFNHYISSTLAVRLQKLTYRMQLQEQQYALSGQLRVIELSYLFQALSASTGLFVVNGPDSTRLGEFYVEFGELVSAWYRQLQGEDAFWSLFEEDPSGTFYFIDQFPQPSKNMLRKPESLKKLCALALERREELRVIRSRIMDLETPLKRVISNLNIAEAEYLNSAQSIMQILLKKPTSVASILQQLQNSNFHVFKTLDILLTTGHIAYCKKTPYGYA